nr:reverse transcriptase domain-containing protein [Tanacetum cinerariifolium]
MQTRSSSRLVRNQSSNPSASMNPNLKGRNRRRSKQRIENLNLDDLSSPVVTMADQRTMAQLLQAPTEGYEDAIVVPAIIADNFKLKHGLLTLVQNKQFFGHDKKGPHAYIRYFNKITSTLKFLSVPNTSIKLMLFPFSLEGAAQIWLEKEPPQSIFTWDDLFSKFINQFFPSSKTTNLRNEITNFQQWFDESFSEACDRFKDLLRACPHHGFLELHQLDTFYNALNSKDQDSLNFAAGGNFLDKMPRECLGIIKSKFKVRYSRNKPVVAKVSTTASTSGVSPDVVELKDMVRALLLDKKGQSPAPVKVVEESYVTCGGAHSYRNCSATDGNNYRDNIQKFVSQASAVNFSQRNTGHRPPMMSNQTRPPVFPPLPNNQNLQRNNQNRFIPNQNQNRGNNFNQGPVYQPLVFQPPAYQEPAYQASAPKTQGVSKEEFSAYVKANDAVMRNMQMQGQNMQNQLTNLTDSITNGVSYDGPQILPLPSSLPPAVEDKPEATKDTVDPTNNGNTKDVQPQAVHSKPVTSLISEPTFTPVSAQRLNPKASIPYPSRRNDERNREKAKDQNEKFYQIFKDMSFEISFADALILIPKFASTLKALIGNKEKLSEMDRTPLNKHCFAVLLKKLSEELGDPGKFLIPCDFPGMTECVALGDLGASINLMPYPVGIAEDVYVKVGSFYFSANFVVVDFDADPRVPLILGRSFLKTGRALIDVFEVDEPLVVELKELPPHLEYAFLEGDDKLPGINPEFYTHKILMEEDFEPTVQHQRRVNPKIYDVIKQEVIKLLEAGLIYPISDSPWVSLVHCVPKKGGFTVVENEDNELIPTRLVTGWRVCIDYHKLNEATRKNHFPLPFMDQMLERLTGNQYYCFLDGFSGYFQIPIDPKDQEKTTFTCPYETFAYRRMPFGLCNAPGTFQRFMMAIFYDMIKKTMEVFMDDFSVFRDSFQSCLSHLDQMLKRCEDTNLCLNWEKSHFMVNEGIVLGHKISKQGIEVDKAKVDVITKLPHPTTVKGIRSFLGYRCFIKDFSKIARPMTRLLEKDAPFIFSPECVDAFRTLKIKLCEAPILIAPNWDIPFELMCDASDFAIGAVLGQRQDKHFRPIHYASKTMTEAESKYTTTEKEMLAVVPTSEKGESQNLRCDQARATRKNHFPLPFMDQMLERLTGNQYYCFLDGFSGYFQIPIDPKDQEKTTFTCPYGTFANRRMPFGLCNAPGTFQSCLSHLDQMLKRCEDTNLCLNWEKSHFMVNEGIVLGHKISKQWIEVDKAKVDVITKLPHPTNVKGIRSFLGHAGFYRCFIKDFSKIARPMTRLLEKDAPFIFSPECVDAFRTLKIKLCEAPILIAPNWDMPFELMCDASDFAIRTVLGKRQDNFADALMLMPKFASTLKALIGNKEKLSEMARTPLNEHCSTVLLKKLPEKLGDPCKFLIPCDFPGMAECLALADLGASINLMPYSVWKRLSLYDLTPTFMTLELADRSITSPVGIAEDVYVKVSSFYFLANFVVVDFDADPRVPLILGPSFLKTGKALIDVFEGELTLRVGKEAITFNLDQTSRYSANYNDMTAKRIDVIDMASEEYSQEVLGFSDTILSENPTLFYDPIVSTTSPTLTPFRNSDFLL